MGGAHATHFGGVDSTKLRAVHSAVDRASTEQRAGYPKLLASHPARALGGQVAAKPSKAYAETLLRRAIRTRATYVDVGLLAGVVPRVVYGFVCAPTDGNTHAILALME